MSKHFTNDPQVGEPGVGLLATAENIAAAESLESGAVDGLAPGYPPSVRKTVALVLVAAVGMYIMMLTLSTALSLRIAAIAPDTKETSLSLAVSIAALLQLIAIPIGGALSDRTTSRLGRRRPWIIGLLIPALLTMAIIGAFTSMPLIVVSYVVGITCAQLAFSTYAVIPVEGIPDKMRARVMGLMGMFGALAFSGGSFLAAALQGVPVLMMTAPVLLALVCTLPLLFLYKDPAKAKADVPPLDVAGLFKNLIVDPRKYPDFGWVWLARFLAGVAMTGLLPTSSTS